MQTNPTDINTQSGNILIYILGAIVLIGLLTVMVKGSSTPGSNINREELEIRVAEVQQYGNELERAVAYVLRNGYSESDIRFAHPNHSSAYGNITNDPGRQIFAREGGGATWRDNDDNIQITDTDWVYGVGSRVVNVGTNANSEIILWLSYVTEDFCVLINEKNGIINPSGNPPQDGANMNVTGIVNNGNFPALTQLNATETDGKLEGCVEGGVDPPAGTYHYYRVLLAR